MQGQRLSVVILTKNAQDCVGACLESVKWADEIVVIDGFSTDNTPEICKKYTDKVIPSEFRGFALERNKGIDNSSGDWILQLDADEVVTPQLASALKEAMVSGSGAVGYKFRRKNYFLGHAMRYGGWYHYSAHFFKKGCGRYEGLIHERLKLTGPQGVIEAEIEHRPFKSMEQFLERQNRYTGYEARDMLNEKGVLPLKVVLYNLKVKPLKLFWKLYIKKQGFREGRIGFIFCVMFAYVHFMKWAKYWELTYGEKAG
jgi:glycosyltransferase involved in cell wall biosynthesis